MLQLTNDTFLCSKNIKASSKPSSKIKCIFSQNNIRTAFYLNRSLKIKDIKTLILKNLDIDTQSEDNKSNLTKSDNTTIINKIKAQNKILDNTYISQTERNTNKKEEKKETNKSLDLLDKNNLHKKVNLFFKGKELLNDEEMIGNLVSNNGIEELELSVIILSLNDSSFIDENKTKEKLINKIVNKCSYHQNNKEIFICTNCNIAFCKYCSNKHKSHEIIERKDIIKFNNELKNLNVELNKKLTEANIKNIYEIKENKNTEYNTNIEKLQNRLDSIKKIYREIVNNYKSDIDKSLPYLLEYKEKVEQLIDNSYNLDTIQDDQQFIDYYFWYINIKQKQEKIEKEIQELDKIQHNFDNRMKYFDEKIKSIYAKTEEDYNLLKQIYHNNNNELKNQINTIPTQKENGLPKLNLFNLFNKAKIATQNSFNSNITPKFKNSKDISEISSNTENENSNQKISIINNINKEKSIDFEKVKKKFLSKSYVQSSKFYTNRKSNKSLIFEEIEEKSEKEETLDDLSLSSQKLELKKILYNIKPKSQNIFYFDIKTKKIEEKTVNFDNLSIDIFEENQGILNYRNNFYISGGNQLKIFYKYYSILNNFIDLKEMPTVHSSHGMLGMGNYIYVIGGLLSKKVERYDINKNSWENLNELNENRIWPSCFGYNNKYIYVFGGSKNNLDEEDIDIERINISSLENKWKKIKLNYKTDIKFPYNFGLINFNENQFMIIGGKFDSDIDKKSQINNSILIKMKSKEIEIKKEKHILPNKNIEFNGKLFTDFGDGFFGEFSSTSRRTFYFININKKTSEEIN